MKGVFRYNSGSQFIKEGPLIPMLNSRIKKVRWKTLLSTSLGCVVGIAAQVQLAHSTELTQEASERFHTVMNARAIDQKQLMRACVETDAYQEALQTFEHYREESPSYLTFSAPRDRVQAVLEHSWLPFSLDDLTLQDSNEETGKTIVFEPMFSDSERPQRVSIESEEEKTELLDAQRVAMEAEVAAESEESSGEQDTASVSEEQSVAEEAQPSSQRQEQPILEAIDEASRALVRNATYLRVIDQIYVSQTRLRGCLRGFAQRAQQEQAQEAEGQSNELAKECPLSQHEIRRFETLNQNLRNRFVTLLKARLSRKLHLNRRQTIQVTAGNASEYVASGNSYRFWEIGNKKITLQIPSSLDGMSLSLDLDFKAVVSRGQEIAEAVQIDALYAVKNEVPREEFQVQLKAVALMKWDRRPREIVGGLYQDDRGNGVEVLISGSRRRPMALNLLIQDYLYGLNRYSQALNRCTVGVSVEALPVVEESEWVRGFGEEGYWSENLQREYESALERYGSVGNTPQLGNKAELVGGDVEPEAETETGPVLDGGSDFGGLFLDENDPDDLEDELNNL